MQNKKKVVLTSGYFNPLHIGHVNLIKEAKKLGDFLVIVVNNDEQVRMKGSARRGKGAKFFVAYQKSKGGKC